MQGWAVACKSAVGCIYGTTDGGVTWTRQDSLGKALYDIHFANAMAGVAAGASFAHFRYTKNGGATWDTTKVTDYGSFTYTAASINAVVMLSPTTVVATGWGSWYQSQPTMLYRSTDGGASYAFQVQSPGDRTYGSGKDFYFKDSLNGMVVGGQRGANIARTADGGQTWTPLPVTFGHILSAVAGAGDNVWVIGQNGFIAKSTDFGSHWQILTKHHGDAIRSLNFVGASTGFMTTANASAYKTTDAGATWSLLPQVTAGLQADAILAAQFVDGSVGYIGQDYGQALKTTDGGLSWSVLLPSEVSFQSATRALHFVNTQVGFLARSNTYYSSDQVKKTTDGGGNWATKDSIMIKQPRAIKFLNASKGILAGDSRSLRYTTDGGTTWSVPTIAGHPAGVGVTGTVYDLCIIDSTHAWAAGNRFLYFSSNMGQTWNYVAHGFVGTDTSFYGINFKDVNNGYAVGYKGLVLKTTNGGANWTSITEIPSSESVYGPVYDGAGNPWVYTPSGRLYTTSGVVSAVPPEGEALPQQYVLGQSYPNPFNPATTITFSLPQSGHITVKVYNVLGAEVATLVDGVVEAGNHAVTFDGSRLASGVYLYRLEAGRFSAVRRTLLVK
jgi:photosystem II stability/assembly factor-like uncharacterized protein